MSTRGQLANVCLLWLHDNSHHGFHRYFNRLLIIFNSKEIEILENYGMQFECLMKGDRAPQTPAQERFIRVCRDEIEPETKYEKVWWKYIKRLQWESDPGNRTAMGPPRKLPESFGGNREDWKTMRRRQWSDLRKRSRGA